MEQGYLNPTPSAAALEGTLFELKCATDIVDAIQTAMSEGHFMADAYTDALCGAVLYLHTVQDQFKKQIFMGGDE